MKSNAFGVLLAAALAIPMIVAPGSVYGEWSGGIEGGTVVQGDGNGSLIRFKMSNSERPLNQQFYADWIRGNSGSSYKVGYEPQYWFTDITYVFGDASFGFGDASASIDFIDSNNSLTTQAVPIDQQRNLFAGLGIRLLDSATTSLFAEIGAGQSSTKFDSVNNIPDQDTNSTTARVGASQILTNFFKLELDGDFTTAEDIERTTAQAGISFRVPGGAIKYTYRARTTEVDGQEAVDTNDSFVSFNYGF